MKLISKLVILSCFALIIFADQAAEIKAKLQKAQQEIQEAIKNKQDFQKVDISQLKQVLENMKGGKDNQMVNNININIKEKDLKALEASLNTLLKGQVGNIENKIKEAIKDNKDFDAKKVEEMVNKMSGGEDNEMTKKLVDSLKGKDFSQIQKELEELFKNNDFINKVEETIKNKQAIMDQIKLKLQTWQQNGELDQILNSESKEKLSKLLDNLDIDGEEIQENIKCGIQYQMNKKMKDKFKKGSSEEKAFKDKMDSDFNAECEKNEQIYENLDKYIETAAATVKERRSEHKRERGDRDQDDEKNQWFGKSQGRNRNGDNEEPDPIGFIIKIALVVLVLAGCCIGYFCYKKHDSQSQQTNNDLQLQVPKPYMEV